MCNLSFLPILTLFIMQLYFSYGGGKLIISIAGLYLFRFTVTAVLKCYSDN